eukprot:scaffold86487_cov40-Prasinocladus_malaysianus.AAC.2
MRMRMDNARSLTWVAASDTWMGRVLPLLAAASAASMDICMARAISSSSVIGRLRDEVASAC